MLALLLGLHSHDLRDELLVLGLVLLNLLQLCELGVHGRVLLVLRQQLGVGLELRQDGELLLEEEVT